MKPKELITTPLIDKNPVILQVLGICPALGITNSVMTAVIMTIATTGVLVFSSVSISLIRKYIPTSVRIIIQVTIIATGVIVVDQVLQAFLPGVARTLSVFIGLIVTNCIVLGRAEAFAVKNKPWPSMLDGIGHGMGYGLVLVAVGTVREILGSGTWFNIPVLPLASEGGWYSPNQMALLAPSAFFIVGALIWVVRSNKPEQVEKPDFEEVKVVAVETAA
ncbi:MAG: NADH:ubiquinone reductase (Na(+)-transporting) subunit D [Woeseiaceae bacterium]|nr:NADH:ubiquinone reductase (Na(+)-transporting) subunit D [Woeseiaceae bacterium]